MEERSNNPTCKHCGRKMQLNTAASTPTVKQYICGCTGIIYHKNVVEFGRLELKKKDPTWPR